ncbi:MAG: ABC transporter ATP-binding protein [Gammaproteobacteria bacterium]|nr:ABC transporter ATP-binding protein [Gammaproteobacteria bacterium]MDH5653892.1 ABC transporter ATP-binding protein [Gammaproteobacteria bacterium]
MTETTPLLSVRNLSVAFGRQGENRTQVVHNVSFDIAPGEKLALVGESGSGKSVTAMSILRLHDPTQTHYPNGEVRFESRELLSLDDTAMRRIRGHDIAMIFQEPMTSLNPVYTIGDQLTEPLILHQSLGKEAARKRAIELLDRTGIIEPGQRIDAFPHMLSGGQRQRVMIAIALACSPKLLIADEPTTALDVTVQSQIIELLEDIQEEFGMAVMMITHDLNMVRRFAKRVCVMQNGQLVEQAELNALFDNPQHDYTRHLLNSRPTRIINEVNEQERAAWPVVLEAESIKCYFPVKAGFFRRKIGEVRAVDDVSLQLRAGETLGIVGESGSGKTTFGMCLLRLQACTGAIRFTDQDLQAISGKAMRPLRRHFQIVFQDPFSSLSPRMTVEQIISEGLKIHYPEQTAAQHRTRILQVLQEVGLDESMLWRYPHEFSGGQRQRIAIARAVVLEPKVIMLDEPTSALDVSVQKQVLELLAELQRKHGISYLFITHDLAVIRAMAHRIIVMKDGAIVEQGETGMLFNDPQQPYTRQLLKASLFREG